MMSNRSGPSSPFPSPLPPHPKQAKQIKNQVNLERIDPPRIKFKTFSKQDQPGRIDPPRIKFKTFANQDPLERIEPPRIKFKTSPNENQDDNRYANSSPEANTKKTENIQINPAAKHTKKEELIEASYLKRILSKEINLANKNATSQQQEQIAYSTDVPSCCYAPPCINYINGCKEIKKSLNYGRRVQIIDQTPCNHYLIGDESCEKCCRLITINRNLFSLHCAWHHQLLTCIICKMTISDLEHRVFRGKIYCGECFNRAKGLHGQELRTVHKRTN